MKYITDLPGVYAYSVKAGIRGESSERYDLGYLYVPRASGCAVLGTRNHFKSASVITSIANAKRAVPKVLIVNSGNSNAATGARGFEDVNRTLKLGKEAFNVSEEEVLLASTGIIGVPLPIERIEKAFPSLTNKLDEVRGDLLAEAILTTDLCQKFSSSTIQSKSGRSFAAAGIAKGSGMIAPNMGTMFSFIVLNAPLNSIQANSIAKDVVDATFNMMSVDTDTSTSDLFVLFANAVDGDSSDLAQEDLEACHQAVHEVSKSLSQQIARDGEGASKLLTVRVEQAATLDDARAIAKAVVDSPLVKTAVHGADPNWGRVIMAVGKNPEVRVEPEKVSVSFGSTEVFKAGEPTSFKSDLLRQYLLEESVVITIRLGLGDSIAEAYGCDLTKGYIDINTCYN